MKNVVCRKCGKSELWAKSLCKTCYDKYYYAQTHYDTTLQDFVTKEQPIYHTRQSKRYQEFVKLYNQDERPSVKQMAILLNTSRQTVYSYIKKYLREGV